MWGFWDSAHWRPQAAIAEGEDVTPNEAGEAYIRLIHEVTTILNLGIFSYNDNGGKSRSGLHLAF